jgi:murein DD-endopeptidase MepM/ murein hydrolase activator NlpD
VVFLQLTFDSSTAVPNALYHRLYFKSNDATVEERMLESTPMVVRRTPPLLIPPPLHGGGWLATSGFSNESGHRRSLLIVNGTVRIPQRYAADWARVGSDGQLFHGDPTQNENWHAYGAEAVAVASGVVVNVLDGIPENVPLAGNYAVTITLATVGGNYVLLELGNHAYAFYGHLQPGSITVKVGDRVQRGQVLGLVGNSGDSSGPHLHFHISDAPSPLGAEGLPYHFTSFEVQGIAESLELFLGGAGWQPEPDQGAESRQREIPVQNAIVNFP